MNYERIRFWLPAAAGLILLASVVFLITNYFFDILRAIGVTTLLILAILFFFFIRAGVKIVSEYDRLVIFRLGKCVGVRGPGAVFVIPFIDDIVSVDTRERFQEVSHETCITKDNARIDVDFLFYWKVVNPVWSQIRVQNLEESLKRLATGLLRAVIGGFQLDEALDQRERINENFKDKLEEVSEHWGVTVTTVEIREILPPPDIQESMHRQLAAERNRRAKMLDAQGDRDSNILRAEGQAMALERLHRTAKEVDPKTLQLKYLDALTELGKSDSTKFVFPLEFTQFLKPFIQGQDFSAVNANSAHTLNRDELNTLINALPKSAGEEDVDNE